MRNFIYPALGLCGVLFAFSSIATAHEVTAPADPSKHVTAKLNDRVYVVHGPQGMPSPENRGFMNNPGFILTSAGVVVVDPGSSRAVGRDLLKRVRTVTDKPVIAVFNTHVHGDHWLGNHAVREAYPRVPIYAHTRMIERVRAGAGQEWRDLFNRMTKGALEDTKPIGPDRGLKGGETLVFGDTKLRIHHTGQAHTDNDIMIEVTDAKTLFTGDIVTADSIPSAARPQDASYYGQARAIRHALDTGATLFVPGHGKSGGREIPEQTLAYLNRLTAAVERFYKEGMTDFEMKDKVAAELAEFRHWRNFDRELGRVISQVYLEVEAKSF